MVRSRSRKDADDFQFACYDAVHALGAPSSVATVAERLGAMRRASEVNKILVRLVKQKALSRKKVRGTWHYYI
jgi:hypothetical protein